MKIGVMVVPIPFPPDSVPSPFGTEHVIGYTDARHGAETVRHFDPYGIV